MILMEENKNGNIRGHEAEVLELNNTRGMLKPAELGDNSLWIYHFKQPFSQSS